MIQLMLYIFAAGAIVLGLVVFASGRTRRMNNIAAAINFCIALWSITVAQFLTSTDAEMARLFAQGFYIAAGIFAALLMLLSFYFVQQTVRLVVWLPVALMATAIVASILFIPDFMIRSIGFGTSPYVVIDPVTYLIYSAYFVFLFVSGMTTLLRGFVRSKGARRSQLASYITGIAWMSVPGFITNLILPFFQIYDLVWVGPMTSVLFLATLSYSIMRHGLFDVRLAVARTTAYVLTLGTIVALYVGSVYLLSELLFTKTSLPQVLLNAGITIVLVLAFQPIKRLFDRVTHSIFYRNRYSRSVFNAELSKILTGSIDLQPLLRASASLIAETFGAEQVSFVVPEGARILNIGTKGHVRMARADFTQIASWHRPEVQTVHRSAIVRSILEESKTEVSMRRLLKSYRTHIVLVLRQANEVKGILLVGERRSGRYTPRDFTVLDNVADELAIALQNAMSLREVRLLNDTLQQRIDEATKELRMSNAQLRRLDEVKDEFISMASHQLRTPLTSIKGYIDMMLEGDAGKITPTQEKFLTEAFVSSERMVHLINDFLNVSRLQTGKFIIDKRPANLGKIVTQELESLKVNASGRQLLFQLKVGEDVPEYLMIDEAKLRQVIMNFSDNAIYYSRPDSTIKVALVMRGNNLEFTVKDTGIGVPESEQSQLFTKFFRASNARKQRPDGTGVGLYLAKRVVTGHGGEIIFSSVEGKGSTFGFSLPVAKLRVRDNTN